MFREGHKRRLTESDFLDYCYDEKAYKWLPIFEELWSRESKKIRRLQNITNNHVESSTPDI